MSAGMHTPGLGVEISLRIGQRVRHRDYKGQRVTGVVRGLQVDQEGALMADVALDAPIVIPADSHSRAIDIHRQYAPAHEFSPFDDRDEVIKGLLALLQGWVDSFADCIEGGEADPLVSATRAAIAKESGASTDHDPQRSQPAEAGEVLRHVGGVLGGEAGAAVQEDLVAVGRPIPGQLAHQVLAEGLREEDTAAMVLAIFPEGDGECERLVLSVDRQVPPIRLPHEAVRQRDAQIVDLAAHVRALPKARIATLTGPQGCGKTSIAEPLRQLLGLLRIVEEGEGDPSALWYDGDLVVQATSQATWASEFVRDCRDDFSNRAEGC